MNASCGVIVLELLQFSKQVHSVPEEHAVEILAPNRADQAFGVRMRGRGVRNRLELINAEDVQVREPAVKAKQRVGGEILVRRQSGAETCRGSAAASRNAPE